jgi:Lon protease-like protein
MVLFPGSSIPIQIFEERYKLMLRYCRDNDLPFGVVLIKSGAEVGEPAIPYSIGTIAHIIQITPVDGGRIFIAVTGGERFEIKAIEQYRPYMTAEIEPLVEGDGMEDSTLDLDGVRASINEYSRLYEGLRGGWVNQAYMPSNLSAMSYAVADILQVDLPAKQNLLEQPSAAKRLETEWELLKMHSAALKRRVADELRGRFSMQ